MDTQMNSATKQLSAIDRALAAAKSRRAQKEAGGEAEVTENSASSVAAPEAAAKPVLTDEQRAEKKLKREAEKHVKMVALEAQRTARKADKAEKRATKVRVSADGRPVHMKKIATAAAKLPQLNSDAQLAFNDLTTNFSGGQLTALALHLAHHNRIVSTQRAATINLKVGRTVSIVGGDHRFIGKIGVISKVQRIRCYVTIPGMEKPYYCFTSDVTAAVRPEAVASEAVAEAVAG